MHCKSIRVTYQSKVFLALTFALLLFGCGQEEKEAKQLGFASVAEMKEMKAKGYDSKAAYDAAVLKIKKAEEEKSNATKIAAVSKVLEHHMECVYFFHVKQKMAKLSGDDKLPEYELLVRMLPIYLEWHRQKFKDAGASENFPQEEANRIIDAVTAKYSKLMRDGAVTEEFLAALDKLTPCISEYIDRKEK